MSQRRQIQWSFWAIALIALGGLVGVNFTLAQGTDKAGADKAVADKAGAAKAAGDTPAEPPKFSAKNLIGDDVADADAPQYKSINDAIAKFLAREPEETKKLFKEAKTTFPKLAPEEVLMAKMWIVAKQSQQAREELEQAVRTNPKDPEAFLFFAEAAIAERRITDADTLTERASKLLETYADNPFRKNNLLKRYYNSASTVLETRKNWMEAKALLERWIALETDNKLSAPHLRLGQVFFQLNQQKEAWDEFNKASTMDKNVISPNVAVGMLFHQNKDKDNAKRFFDIALKEKPTAETKDRVLKSHLLVANWAISNNDVPLAHTVSAAALTLDNSSLDANLLAANLARLERNFLRAEQLLEALHTRYPSNFIVSNQLALVLAEQNDTNKRQRAVELAQINYQANNQQGSQPQVVAEALTTLAVTLYRNGKVQDAAKIIQELAKNNALNNPDALYYVARIQADGGLYKEAIQTLTAALREPIFFNKTEAQKLHDELIAKVAAAAAPLTTDTPKKDAPKTTPTSGK